MPRTIPIPPPELKTPTLETWTLELKTITPMFGGSATPRAVDPENPVRAASVRGHLRFWWRATAGGQYASAEKLFEAEEEIWGSDASPGKVSIKVLEAKASEPKPCCTYEHPRRDGGIELKTYPYFSKYPGYALFPFQGKARNESGVITITEEPSKCLEEVSFNLCLSFPNYIKLQVELAVAMWLKFGGIGARTRRGCGSLEIVEGTFAQNARLESAMGSRANSLLTTAQIVCFVGEEKESPIRAWKDAVEVYKEFRQGKDYARDPGSDPKKPAKLGRSRYPEPDTIREMFTQERWQHKVKHPVRGFPRADLGLPIVFHFQKEGPKDESFTLESDSKLGARFASPVITKALKGNGGYAPAIILLDAPHVWGAGDLVLKLGREKKAIPRNLVELTPEERKKVSPLGGLPIREALVEFAKSRGYEEVHL
jgi:CRISPR-associated protein Cmr1